MVTGEREDVFYSSLYKWSPEGEHTLAYLVPSNYLGLPDELVLFDPATGEKTHPEACPSWMQSEYPQACSDFPGVIIGGRISGVPDDLPVTIIQYSVDKGMPYGVTTWYGSVSWQGNLRRSAGVVYTIKAEAAGYVGTPVSYTIQISGTKAYLVTGGQVSAEEALHLDFNFVRAGWMTTQKLSY